jgi:protein TonB
MKYSLLIFSLFSIFHLFSQEDSTSTLTFLDSVSGKQVMRIMDVMPRYPGGEVEMFKYLSNINYPETKESIHNFSTMYIGFIIGVDGQVSDVRLVRVEPNPISKTVIETIKRMPKWKPGSHEGKKYNCLLTLPFRIHPQ